MAKGIFILSLDCEGKWGVADHVDAVIDEAFTDRRLERAYEQLLALFATHDVPATFAFVMAFILDEAERQRFDARLEDVAIGGRSWLHTYRSQQERGMQGWYLPTALERVRDDGRHEVASHGFSHLPVGDPAVDAEMARREFTAAADVASAKGLNVRTFVYPRNLVAYEAELAASGIQAFRTSLDGPEGIGRVRSALREFDVRGHAQKHGKMRGSLQEIPPGYFLNWRSGFRRRIPRAVTTLRWKRMIDDAARNGGVVHLWLHPHNLITAPDTFDALARIVAHAAARRDEGRISILTQEGYLDRLRAG